MHTTYHPDEITAHANERGPKRRLRDAQEAFAKHKTLHNARPLMREGTAAWAAGWIGDATYVREVLEPVRAFLLAGNDPR